MIPVEGGTFLLPRLVGIDRACQLIWTGNMIDAKEAERIGLVTTVVPHKELKSATRELAESLARGPTLALGMLKQSVYQALQTDLATALRREANCLAITAASEDCKEGTKAFLEKRKPEFRSR